MCRRQNNNAPSVEVIVSRARAPIARAEHWQECIVQGSATATVTSVAVEKTGREFSNVYAYIAGGVLTVKKAEFVIPLRRMQWQTVETIPNAVACAVEFDGRFSGMADLLNIGRIPYRGFLHDNIRRSGAAFWAAQWKYCPRPAAAD